LRGTDERGADAGIAAYVDDAALIAGYRSA